MKDFNKFYKINSRDVEILNLVHLFRFLPLKSLSSLLIRRGSYTKYQAVCRNVNRLIKDSYLRYRKYDFNAKFLFLTSLGADILSFQTNIPREYINTPVRLSGVNLFALEHTLKVVNVYEIFYTEFKKHNLEMIDFRGDGSVRIPFQFRLNGSGKLIKQYIMPDALMRVKEGEEEKVFFIEYDKGTEYSKDVALKYTKYFQYFLQPTEWEGMFNEFPTIIFIVEKTKQRILNLISKADIPDIYGYSDRDKFAKSRNVVIKGVRLHENLRSTPSSKVSDFLKPDRFLFIDMPTLKKEGLEAKFLNFMQEETKLLDFNSLNKQ